MARPTGDVNKLPGWAQRYIAKLESNNNSLRNQLQAVSEADSPVTWRYVSEDYGIPRLATVSFSVWKHYGFDVRLTDDGNSIEITGSGRAGNSGIRIKPRYANSVIIELDSIEEIRQRQAVDQESEADNGESK